MCREVLGARQSTIGEFHPDTLGTIRFAGPCTGVGDGWNDGSLCRVVSCRVVSCRVVSCRVVSCRVVSCRVVSCRVVSCRVVSCRVCTRPLCSALGLILRRMGRLSEAEPYYYAAYTGSVRVLGRTHSSTTSSLYNLGVLRSHMKDTGQRAGQCINPRLPVPVCFVASPALTGSIV
jgi:hypothetical protein